MRIEGLTLPVEGPRCQAHGATNSPGGIPRLLVREKIRPAHPLQRHFREEVRPTRHKTPILGHFSCAGRASSRLHDDHSAAGRTFSRTAAGAGDAGRKISRTGLRNMATLKPTTPLHTHNKGPMKPPSPLRRQTAPKTPNSHPQRRWRFQLAHLTGPQRRRWFQTTGPPGRQGQAAAHVGPETMSDPAISHLDPPTRTWAR